MLSRILLRAFYLNWILLVATAGALAEEPSETSTSEVSYHKQILPIFQAQCLGCHQPAKAGGGFVMTSFENLLGAGDSESLAIVPGKPEESYLFELITPSGDSAEMPKDSKPLSEVELSLIRTWIEQGAKDDTPPSSHELYSSENPPKYYAPPVITSLDYSPDGSLLAVAGFHEVLLHKSDGSGVVGRLVGMSERIESVQFSPDGSKLAVAGGQPGRMGEIQVWDVAKQRLKLSLPISHDTIYGANWSPDGKLISFGCADNTLRVIKASTGKQVLFQGSHDDWVLGTVFSEKGDHIISVGRDRTAKLTELETQRFIDNITTITPGISKGGIGSVDRHPTSDAIVVGGEDGVPKIFRIFRESKRVIGDDANQIKRLPALNGPVYSVAFNHDGTQVAACSSLNGVAELAVFSVNFEVKLPEELKTISEKVITTRSAEENQKIEAARTSDISLVSKTSLGDSGLYTLAFSPDGQTIAAAGSDGQIRLFKTNSAEEIKKFMPVTLSEPDALASASSDSTVGEQVAVDSAETLPTGTQITGLTVQPPSINLNQKFDTVQLVISASLADGSSVDVTRIAERELSADVVTISPNGLVRTKLNGQARLTLKVGEHAAVIPIDISELRSDAQVSYIRDVAPVLSTLGCNAGTCHGSKDGQNGFKLSLRGYDSLFDVRALTEDLSSRRINIASPADSLALLKATGVVPHVGGQLTKSGEPYYELLHRWIATGATLDTGAPEVASISIYPENPIVQQIGDKQQVRILATYSDGSQRDVTAEAFINSSNTDIVAIESGSLINTLRRGESAILARYEGAYAATTVTVMGDRTGFAWEQPAVNNPIDELTAQKWQRMKILPSDLCSDAEFIRRVYLDLTGLPPTSEETKAFLNDDRPTKVKRDEVIDRLVGNEAYVEHWTNKWADLLQVNRKFLGEDGSKLFRSWIKQQVADNTPYDKFVYSLLTSAGSNRENPNASYYKILRTPEETMENTTHLFLAVRFNCNKCHDHPFERWTQDQYYETAAFFAQVGLKKDPESKDSRIAGTAVEGGKPLYEIVYDQSEGEIKHDRTGLVTPPKFPYLASHTAPENATRRERLARWITSPDNQYFARSYVNRIWGYLLGTGLIDPLDDIRAGNPPSNPKLLDWLTQNFVEGGFSVQDLIRTICKSRTYQLSIETNQWNEDDTINYSHAQARRLPAEVLYDAMHLAMGTTTNIPGVPPGTRAAQLPDVGVKLESGFLQSFGRPARESACECERSAGMELGPVMALVSGPTVNSAINQQENALAKLAASDLNDAELVSELFLRILSRNATAEEVAAGVQTIQSIPKEHEMLVADLAKYQEELKPITAQKEQQRLEKIATAQQTLEAYQKELAPKLAEQEKQKQEKTEQLEAELAEYEKTLPTELVKWENEQVYSETIWNTLSPHELSSSFGAKLDLESDQAIFVSEKNDAGSYHVIAKTDLIGITAIRLEVLTDDRLPKKGPGRAGSGNFVLSELELSAASLTAPDTKSKVALQNAKADFNQGGFDISKVIDGKFDPNSRGWAIAPKMGENHVATFELKEPVGNREGTILSFELKHNHSDKSHTLGKFRISVTTSPIPVKFKGLPNNIVNLLVVAADKRNAKQQENLLSYFKSIDKGMLSRIAAINESKKPLPIDPHLKKLQENLEYVSQPLAKDNTLAQLERAVTLSTEQLATGRLAGVQDIAWALVNSSAFLFNR